MLTLLWLVARVVALVALAYVNASGRRLDRSALAALLGVVVGRARCCPCCARRSC